MGERPDIHRISLHAIALVASTYALIVLGSAVRANGAGLACPDWPLCFGEVVPALDLKVAFEFGHRVLASMVSLGFLALVWRVFRRPPLWRLAAPTLLLGGGVLVLQIVLGGLTVLELLAEWTVTSHLLAGNLFGVLMFLTWKRIRALGVRRDPTPGSVRARVAVGGIAGLVTLQLALGGLVSSSGAGLACGTWPACNGPAWFPTFSGLVGLQVMHRLVAYTLLVTAFGVALWLRGPRSMRRASMAVCAAVCLQACLGICNVLFYMPPEITVLHSAGAALVVLCTAWLNYEAWHAPVVRAGDFVRSPGLATSVRQASIEAR